MSRGPDGLFAGLQQGVPNAAPTDGRGCPSEPSNLPSAGRVPRRGQLQAEHRRWIVANALVGTAVVNAAINAALAWVSVRGVNSVPVWTASLEPSIVSDSLGTLFFLPLITTVLCTTAVWRDLRVGRLERLEGTWCGLGDRLRNGRLRRGMTLAAWCTGVLSPVTVVILVGIDFGDLNRTDFVLYKTAFAVGLGAIVTPFVALRAMSDAVVPTRDQERADGP